MLTVKLKTKTVFFFVVYLVTAGALFFLNELKKIFNPHGILLLNGIY